jgi:OmcA/MtrC family decaheme c-type cytochrome
MLGGPFARTGPSEYGFANLTDPATGANVAWPRTESVPVASVPDGQGWYTYQFAQPVPDAATGVWTVVLTARRQGPTKHYDLVTKRFSWPYTGETVSEVATQVVVHVDTATGAWRAGDPVPAGARRAVVDQALCERCHRRIALHGGTRNAVAGCLLCHTPERTDWNQRKKDAAGNVDRAQTYDGLEEQSIHFKVMIERIHTGSGQGTATLPFEPYVIHGNGQRPFFFADGTFPDEVRRCDRCHLDGTWRPEAVPAGAGATVANETTTLRHAGTVAHGDEPAVPPLTASCTSCHGNAFAISHAARNTVNGKEGCVACHGEKGQKATGKVHGLE